MNWTFFFSFKWTIPNLVYVREFLPKNSQQLSNNDRKWYASELRSEKKPTSAQQIETEKKIACKITLLFCHFWTKVERIENGALCCCVFHRVLYVRRSVMEQWAQRALKWYTIQIPVAIIIDTRNYNKNIWQVFFSRFFSISFPLLPATAIGMQWLSSHWMMWTWVILSNRILEYTHCFWFRAMKNCHSFCSNSGFFIVSWEASCFDCKWKPRFFHKLKHTCTRVDGIATMQLLFCFCFEKIPHRVNLAHKESALHAHSRTQWSFAVCVIFERFNSKFAHKKRLFAHNYV